jgi:predicted acylesterase/phospholipase RssA
MKKYVVALAIIFGFSLGLIISVIFELDILISTLSGAAIGLLIGSIISSYKKKLK